MVASGCGGSSKSGSTSTAASATAATTATTATAPPSHAVATLKLSTGKPLTRAEWIAKGDAICARLKTKLAALTVVNEQEYAHVFPQVAVYDNAEAQELSKLVPPTSKAHDWEQILSTAQHYNEYVNKVAGYAEANDFKEAAPLIETATTIHQQMAAEAKQAGFKHCSQTS
ncbi:MAG: hypothetical protein WBV85_08045 [Solirubrobacteraceae bacterium]